MESCDEHRNEGRWRDAGVPASSFEAPARHVSKDKALLNFGAPEPASPQDLSNRAMLCCIRSICRRF